MKARRDIELDISVDQNDLDHEWVAQPKNYFRYAAELADARRDQDQAKAELDLVQAELDQAVRSDPEKFGLSKATEASIKAVVLAQAEYTSAQQAMLKAKHDVDVLQAAVGALDHKRKALENLVTLWLNNYYSSPRSPKGSEDKIDEMKKDLIRRKGNRRERGREDD